MMTHSLRKAAVRFVYLVGFALLGATGGATAQTLENGFETLAGIGSWKNTGSNPGYTLSISNDAVVGSGSLQLDYNFVADQSWGGSIDFNQHSGGFFSDMSDMDGIRFRYKTVTPVSPGSNVSFVVKLVDTSTGTAENWQVNASAVISGAPGQWQEMHIPFGDFTLPSWVAQGDGTLDLDMISEWQMQVIVSGGGVGNTYTGSFRLDDLSVYGGARPPGNPQPFPPPVDEPPPPSGSDALWFSFDSLDGIGSWKNTGSEPGYELSISDDAVEGSGSLRLDYDFTADQSWGGSVDFNYAAEDGTFDDLSAYEGIRFRYKVLDPVNFEQAASFVVKLVDVSAGTDAVDNYEVHVPQVITDESGEWQEVVIPFSDFAVPSWATLQDPTFDLDMISDWQMQVIVGSGGIGTTYTGTVLIDDLRLYGSDSETPPPVVDTGLVTNGSFEATAPGVVEDLTGDVEGWIFEVGSGVATAPEFAIVDDVAHEGDQALRVTIVEAGADSWNIQAVADSVEVTPGATYVFSAWARAAEAGATASFTVGNYAFNEYGRLGDRMLTTEWQEFTFEFTVTDEETVIRAPIHFSYAANAGATIYIDDVTIMAAGQGNVAAEPDAQRLFELEQNYPNPFHVSTTIRYVLDAHADVSLAVFNTLGQRVATLVEGPQGIGQHEVRFDAADLASGVYFYRLDVGGDVQARRMMIVR